LWQPLKFQGKGCQIPRRLISRKFSTLMLLSSLRRTQQLTVVSEPEDEEDAATAVERTQLTTIALKKGL
jgi:hypothetical protein